MSLFGKKCKFIWTNVAKCNILYSLEDNMNARLFIELFFKSLFKRIWLFVFATKKAFDFSFGFFAHNGAVKRFINRLSSFFYIFVIVHIIILSSNNVKGQECPPKAVFILTEGPHKGKALMCSVASEYFILMHEGREQEASKWLLTPIKFEFKVSDLDSVNL